MSNFKVVMMLLMCVGCFMVNANPKTPIVELPDVEVANECEDVIVESSVEPIEPKVKVDVEVDPEVDIEVESNVEKHPQLDIPMDYELQLWVIDHCIEAGMNPHLVFAICERESNFNADAIGDNGKSFGMMQIQRKWHMDRMEKLGCDDLLDPKQNIRVGVDLLVELSSLDRGVEWVLMAYNGGHTYANKLTKNGEVSEYAKDVLIRSNELEGMCCGKI